jgi:L-threonylcarbamoyladenylate synthase
MKVLRIDVKQPERRKLILAGSALKEGKLLVYPTDTVYGIGCAVDSEEVRRVFEIKGRSQTLPLSIACSDLAMAKEYAEISAGDETYIRERLFEPYTFIARKKDSVPDIVTAGKDTVGIRIPDHPVVKGLVAYAGKPIITTSANLSGKPSPASFEEIDEKIISAVDVAIDSGRCRIGKASTVVDLKTKKILRTT